MTNSTAVFQANLARAGFDPGPADGAFGPKTLKACADLVAGRDRLDLVTAGVMWSAMVAQGITTPLRIINFLANVGAETKFALVAENLNYSAKRLVQVWPSRFPNAFAAAPFVGNPQALANKVYGGRMGNDQPGDGHKFRGRGWAQLTGREAYAAVGKLCGLPLTEDPDLVLTPAGSAAASAGFWTWKNLSLPADLDDAQTVRQRWNGGLNGWPDVKAAVTSLKGLWGIT